MSNLEKYVVNDPTPEELAEIKSALTKSDEFVNEIILSADIIEETNKKINNLVSLANQQKEKKVGLWSGKKTAIESLQALADFQADAINELWKNQQLVLDHFAKLSETSNKLVFLGVANAAVTRAIIDQLKTKSSKSLSEDTRRHLLNVIEDLERQADAQDRINRLRESTSRDISKEAEERRKNIDDVKNIIIEIKDSISLTIDNEIAIRVSEIQKLHDSINEIRETYALTSALSIETQERIASISTCNALISELENKLNSHYASLSDLIRNSNEEHSSIEDHLRNEIKGLRSKNKVAIWIGIIATLLALVSNLAYFIF